MKPLKTSAPNYAQLPFTHGKTILLVDVNSTSRDTRAKTFRSLGVNVQTVSTASAALARCDATRYSLVLVDLGADHVHAQALVDEIRARNSHQLVAFLVGSPGYVAQSLHADSKATVRGSAQIGTVAAKEFDFAARIKQAESEAETPIR